MYAAQGFVKIAMAIDQVANELLCEFVRKFGRAMGTATTGKNLCIYLDIASLRCAHALNHALQL